MPEFATLFRRCAVLMLEAQERISYQPQDLIAGRLVPRVHTQWMALAPHLGEAIALEAAEIDALARCSSSQWLPVHELGIAAETIDALCAKGLLLTQQPGDAAAQRDDILRGMHWKGLSAVAHLFSRWRGVDARAAERHLAAQGMALPADTPPPSVEASAVAPALALPQPADSALEQLLLARTTCRNYADAPLRADQLGHVLQRSFGARASGAFAAGLTLLKKGVPSAGGLHPVEALLLLRKVDGLACGLYRYHPVEHTLLLQQTLPQAEADALALRFVAGQEYFAGAPVLLALTARFQRNFWKYREHAKAWRAVILDAGHLSQTLYLAATELQLGAFITAAVNEADIEQAFGLDPLQHGVIAVCGCGIPARPDEVEFDPLGRAAGRPPSPA